MTGHGTGPSGIGLTLVVLARASLVLGGLAFFSYCIYQAWWGQNFFGFVEAWLAGAGCMELSQRFGRWAERVYPELVT